MPTTDFDIAISFISDWHIGQGEGQPGNLDRLVRRDAMSLPYVPAKTLTGILRDGCETVALGLDNGTSGPWVRSVNALFGDEPARIGAPSPNAPLPSRLSIRPAAFPKAFRESVSGNSSLMQALTFAKAGVVISPRTGAAERRLLRMEEMVRGGCVLTARASLNVAELKDDEAVALRALLWAGAKSVRRLGGKRRRGVGRCVVMIGTETERVTWLTRLARNAPTEIIRPPYDDRPAPRSKRSPVSSKAGVAAPVKVTAAEDRWFRIPLTIELNTPVVIPVGVLANSVRTADHIPGTQMLGPLCRALSAVAGIDVNEAVCGGDVQILNAYPSINGARSLPLPFSLQHKKGSGGLDANEVDSDVHIINLAGGEQPPLLFRPHRPGYVLGGDSHTLPWFAEAELTQATHSTIDDPKQRPTTDVGGVFTYQALAAGGRFVTELRCREVLWSRLQSERDWWKRLCGDYRIGIAKKDDYGHVTIAVPQTVASAGLEHFGSAVVTACRLTVWLISDLLMRDARLRPSTAVEDIKSLLERRIDTAIGAKISLTSVNAFARVQRTDGWQVRWQLPRPSYVGLQAGSVLQFDVNEDADLKSLGNALRAIERSGLGERRAEGFGEVRFNDELASSKYGQRVTPTKTSPGKQGAHAVQILGDAGSTQFARLIEREAWRTRIARDASLWAIDSEGRRAALGWTDKQPSNSQLGTLKSLVHAFFAERITGWLDAAVKADKWPKAAGTLLSALVSQQDVAWTHLDSKSWPTISAGGHAQLRKDLWPEAASALLLAAIQAERRERERPRNQTPAPAEVAQ